MDADQLQNVIHLLDNSISLLIVLYAWFTERKRNEELQTRLLNCYEGDEKR